MDSPVQIAGLFTANPLGAPKPSGNKKKKNEKMFVLVRPRSQKKERIKFV